RVDAKPYRLVLALPAYNEEVALPRLLRRVHEAMADDGLAYEIVVVDDGSTDRTGEVLREHTQCLPLHIVTHEQNSGLAQTIHDALHAALERAGPRDVIVAMDADDTHDPGLAPRMAQMVRDGYHVVIASRYCEGSRVRGVPLMRRVMSRLASCACRLLVPISGVRDYTCGYRAYDAEFLRRVWTGRPPPGQMPGFECMLDILLALHRAGAVVREVPLILRYDRKSGGSKMRVGLTAVRALKLLLRSRFRRPEQAQGRSGSG
ncbi:MAG: glycosyltransferase, partial [Armatimonadota bacterium]